MDNRGYVHTEEGGNYKIPPGGIRIPMPIIQPPRRGDYSSLYDEQNYNRPHSIADPGRGTGRPDLAEFDEIPLDEFNPTGDVYPPRQHNGNYRAHNDGRPFSYAAPLNSAEEASADSPARRSKHQQSPLEPIYRSIPARDVIVPTHRDEFPIANHHPPRHLADDQGTVSTVYSHSSRKKSSSPWMNCFKFSLVMLGLLLAAVVAVGLWLLVTCAVQDKCPWKSKENSAINQHFGARVLDTDWLWTDNLTDQHSQYYEEARRNFTEMFANLKNKVDGHSLIDLGTVEIVKSNITVFSNSSLFEDYPAVINSSYFAEFDFDFTSIATELYSLGKWIEKIANVFHLNTSCVIVANYTGNPTTTTISSTTAWNTTANTTIYMGTTTNITTTTISTTTLLNTGTTTTDHSVTTVKT